jgi:DNA-directed RNA polymerase specialized sigma24 family protein
MDALKILADHHKEWVKIVRSFGEQDLAEDVVQDVYLRIVKYNYEEKILKDGKPNIALMWMMLRNRAFEINKTGSVQFLSLDEVRGVADADSELDKHEALERLHHQNSTKRWITGIGMTQCYLKSTRKATHQ